MTSSSVSSRTEMAHATVSGTSTPFWKKTKKTFAVIQQNRPVVRQNGRPQRSRRKKGPIAGLCCRNLPQVSTADGNLAKKPEGIKDSSSIAYLIASYKKCRRRQEQIFVRQSLTGQLRGEMRNLANTATATMHHLHVMLTIQEAGCLVYNASARNYCSQPHACRASDYTPPLPLEGSSSRLSLSFRWAYIAYIFPDRPFFETMCMVTSDSENSVATLNGRCSAFFFFFFLSPSVASQQWDSSIRIWFSED